MSEISIYPTLPGESTSVNPMQKPLVTIVPPNGIKQIPLQPSQVQNSKNIAPFQQPTIQELHIHHHGNGSIDSNRKPIYLSTGERNDVKNLLATYGSRIPVQEMFCIALECGFAIGTNPKVDPLKSGVALVKQFESALHHRTNATLIKK